MYFSDCGKKPAEVVGHRPKPKKGRNNRVTVTVRQGWTSISFGLRLMVAVFFVFSRKFVARGCFSAISVLVIVSGNIFWKNFRLRPPTFRDKCHSKSEGNFWIEDSIWQQLLVRWKKKFSKILRQTVTFSNFLSLWQWRNFFKPEGNLQVWAVQWPQIGRKLWHWTRSDSN